MEYARDHGFVVLTHDLDFGAILAATNASGPSVIQIRTQDILPQSMDSALAAALRQYDRELTAGALIVIDRTRSRVRILPLRLPDK
jgi:predicted nuclease of predicted toxin-antitoxin system